MYLNNYAHVCIKVPKKDHGNDYFQPDILNRFHDPCLFIKNVDICLKNI